MTPLTIDQATTVTIACEQDRHRDCHDHGCVCGCHVLFALIERGA